MDKPTYEELVAYAYSEGLIGKVDTVKFYDYYDRQNFQFRGMLMDWKGKLHEWASKQKSAVIQTAKEANAIQKMSAKKREYMIPGKTTTDTREYLNYIKEVMGLA